MSYSFRSRTILPVLDRSAAWLSSGWSVSMSSSRMLRATTSAPYRAAVDMVGFHCFSNRSCFAAHRRCNRSF